LINNLWLGYQHTNWETVSTNQAKTKNQTDNEVCKQDGCQSPTTKKSKIAVATNELLLV
jgi:hypothetical protein